MIQIGPHTNLTRVDIWAPKYSQNVALIAPRDRFGRKKIGTHNKVVFTKAKHLAGKEFYISETDIVKHPTQSNGSIMCHAVPMEELQEIEKTKDLSNEE